MANCVQCGKKFGFLEAGTNGFCAHCAVALEGQKIMEQAAEANAKVAQRNADIDLVMLTTETAPNLNITKRIEIVTAECAFGMNMFRTCSQVSETS